MAANGSHEDAGRAQPPAPRAVATGGGRPGTERAQDSRRLGRELAMRAIYARDVGLARPLEVLAHLAREEDAPREAESFARELVEGVAGHLAELDRRIAAYARNWSLPRLAAVDRSVLRLAVFELFHRSDVPRAVAVDEAVGLADAFGGEESARFVNGLLGQLVRDLEAGEPRD